MVLDIRQNKAAWQLLLVWSAFLNEVVTIGEVRTFRRHLQSPLSIYYIAKKQRYGWGMGNVSGISHRPKYPSPIEQLQYLSCLF